MCQAMGDVSLWDDQMIIITIQVSKTDQEGRGRSLKFGVCGDRELCLEAAVL